MFLCFQSMFPSCLSFACLPCNLSHCDPHTEKQMFYRVHWLIHAQCLIAGLWNLQVASAKQSPNGCQVVVVTAGRDLPVIVEMMPFVLLIWYTHLRQHKKNFKKRKRKKTLTAKEHTQKMRQSENQNNVISLLEICSPKMFFFLKPYFHAKFAVLIIATDCANMYICDLQNVKYSHIPDFW